MNKLNHNRKLSNLRTEASYARKEKRWGGNSNKSARLASKRYNNATRKAAKLQLKRYAA